MLIVISRTPFRVRILYSNQLFIKMIVASGNLFMDPKNHGRSIKGLMIAWLKEV